MEQTAAQKHVIDVMIARRVVRNRETWDQAAIHVATYSRWAAAIDTDR